MVPYPSPSTQIEAYPDIPSGLPAAPQLAGSPHEAKANSSKAVTVFLQGKQSLARN
jgi:hypothetical protein